MKNLQAIYRPIQVYSNPIFTSNRDKLLWLSGVYRKLGIYNKVFLNTAELLEALAQ
ncbi:MAG TPA: hypothetical protein PK390_01715 [Fervidobacterium nodosum]|nr:hypothetical protein [Fervidobacterium nodosum]